MATIYLLKYNNYYNRQAKHIRPQGQFLTLNDFFNAGAVIYHQANNINFKWGDGVSQEIILNYDCEMNNSPDYCLISDGVNKDVASVWFILETQRLRNGQFKFILYRDLINTYYDSLINTPVFIEKATLENNNPLIFNSENMGFNQIKTSETILKDFTNTAWIVGYVAKDHQAISDHNIETYTNNADYSMSTTRHNDWEYNKNNRWVNRNDISYLLNIRDYNDLGGPFWKEYFNEDGATNQIRAGSDDEDSPFIVGTWENLVQIRDNFQNIYNFSSLYENAKINASVDETFVKDDLIAYDNKTILFSDGIYRIHVNINSITSEWQRIVSDALGTELKEYLKTYCSNNEIWYPYDIINANFRWKYKVYIYSVSFEFVSSSATTSAYHYALTQSVKPLSDANYKMFAIPYGSVKIRGGIGEINTSQNSSIPFAMDLATKLGSSLYDLQILPYCPFANMVTSVQTGGYIYLNVTEGTTAIKLYAPGSTTNAVNFAIFCEVSNFSVNLLDNSYKINVKDYKLDNECNKYRLCSPNYSDVFEFSAAKNGGINGYKIDCTYKPFTPYIRVAPQFANLYGKEFDDNRGLVCTTDFSLPIVNDRWVEYELQNKNYQKTFNRQIENMEVNNSIARQEAIFQLAAGTVQGGASGAMSGAIVGGGVGAIVGGVVGTAAAGIGSAFDYSNLLKKQAETLDYTKDLFGYNLANIQALPNVLSKVGSLFINFKFWPFLEFYTCTEQEKEALANKLKYNGMTVNVIGKIKDYIRPTETYIKGKIIRMDADIDFHELSALAEELNKGVFL